MIRSATSDAVVARAARSRAPSRRTRRRPGARSCRAGRTHSRRRSATAISSSSPAACPRLSLKVLKSSRSMNSTATSRGAGGQRVLHAVDEQRAVREVGERVVEGLVVQLLLELAQLQDRLLEAVVLERDAGVVGERLEQLQVVVAERADHAEAVGEHDRADHAFLARQHREHRVRDPAAVEIAPQPLVGKGRSSRTDGGPCSTSARSSSAIASSIGCMTSLKSPGPSVVRSGGLPSELNSTISASSARKASSERSEQPSSASTISGERAACASPRRGTRAARGAGARADRRGRRGTR